MEAAGLLKTLLVNLLVRVDDILEANACEVGHLILLLNHFYSLAALVDLAYSVDSTDDKLVQMAAEKET